MDYRETLGHIQSILDAHDLEGEVIEEILLLIENYGEGLCEAVLEDYGLV